MYEEGKREIRLLYADQERFYIPEFEIVRQEFGKYDINCQLVPELDASESLLKNGTFLDLPFFNRRPSLYETIIPAYKKGAADFVIPPKPFLGAKGLLGLLRNDGHNPHLESLLRTFVKGRSLDIVRSYLPETFLIGKWACDADEAKERSKTKGYVLKATISSGMKGTIFSNDPRFEATLKMANSSNMNWILQEEVANQPQTFSWFENANRNPPELRTADDWFMRVTVQYVNRRVGDVIVTACRNKAVHGGKECLQLGTVIR
jgi:hypothetical protein